MIVSKYSKSYDTADGTEQQFKDPQRHDGQGDGQVADKNSMKTAGQRWDDGGGSLPAATPPLYPVAASKPAWSVLSLADLNESVRLEYSPDSPVRLKREADETERRRLRAIEVEQDRVATLADMERNRYRNHWENT